MRINHSTLHKFTNSAIAGPILFLAAMLARLGSIGRYVTPDELAWVQRSADMRQAILTADWTNTIQAGHPGVITTWLGAIGVQFTLWFNPSTAADLDFIHRLAWIPPISGEAHKHLAPFLTGGRLMVILATSTGIWLIYHLLTKQFRPTTSFVGAAFLALDPWTAGLSGLLHVDALLATFMLIALILVLHNQALSSRRMLLAGVFTSLAILNKLPAGILLGLIPAILFTRWLIIHRDLTRFAKQLGWWLFGLLAISVVLLPALWAAPAAVVNIVLTDGARITGKRAPIFFMGSADFDLGWHFYPLAVLIRQSPLVTLGVVAGGWLLTRRQISRSNQLFIGTFLLFCLLFWGGITASSREFVRYALPISMTLTLLGGLSLAVFRPKSIWLILILQIGWMAWFWRFPLSTANLITGGPQTSAHQVALGWGDGVSQGAAWAAAQPNASQRTLFTTNVPAAAPFYPGDVFLLDDQTVNLIRPDDFVLIPLGVKQVDPGRWQADSNRPLAEQFPADMRPIHTVTFNGLERAWLYSNIPAELLHANQDVSQHTALRFGEHLFLNAATLSIPQNKHRLVVQTDWQAMLSAEYRLVLTIEDEAGNVWLKQEEPLVAVSGLPSGHWAAEKHERLFQKLTLPADVPPDHYLLKAEVFDATGSRLGVFGTDGQFQGTSAVVGLFQSPLPNNQPKVSADNSEQTSLPLVGYSTPPTHVGQGEKLSFDLWLQQPKDGESNDVLLLKIGYDILSYPLQFPLQMEDWRLGDTYRIKSGWVVPVDFPAGSFPLAIGRVNDPAQVFQPIGQIIVEERDRLFSLPADIDPLQVQFGSAVILQHIDVSVNDSVTVDLIWQANRPDGNELTMFVHLKDANGEIIEQLDRSPVKPTHLWLENEVIIDSVTLPRPEKLAQIAIGLYDPNSGQRLAVMLDGELLPDSQYGIKLKK